MHGGSLTVSNFLHTLIQFLWGLMTIGGEFCRLKFFSQIPSLLKNKSQKKELKQIIKNRYNCLQYQRQSLLIFYFHVFEYCQIWLNVLMHCQLSNIMKLNFFFDGDRSFGEMLYL
jgi:hypothetical protein